MRKDKIKIDKVTLDTMDLLENLPQQRPRYGFYERLNYRIEHPVEEKQEMTAWSRVVRFVGTPIAVAACIAFGIFIGIDNTQVSKGNDLDVLVETYNLNVSETPNLFETESD